MEGDETFRVQIDGSFSLVTNDGATLLVTIKDDDSKLTLLTSYRHYGFISASFPEPFFNRRGEKDLAAAVIF